MGDLLGIIAPLKKFMSNSDEEVYVTLDGEKKTVLALVKDRIYDIPDFQREIRWSSDNVALLVEDIKSGPKFLGNIILTKHIDNSFSIIDGQQRITVLTMILSCIKCLHEDEIEIINPCKLTIESFSSFSTILEQGFDESQYTEAVYESDKLKQISKYTGLWNYIMEMEEIKNKREAKKIIENLSACSFNIIINEADDVSEGIRYFIDVNLKGKQLDVEDIFKSYLFRNDSSEEIRKQWYLLKTVTAEIEHSKMDYSLLKLLEHYFLCDLYRDNKYRGTKAEDTLKMWYSIERGEKKYIYPYQETADAVFNTSLIYELAVLKPLVLPLLAEVDSDSEEYSEARRLYELLSYFNSLSTEDVPKNSLLREFIGGSCY